MPANVPFIKKYVRDFLEYINAWGASETERSLEQETAALPHTIEARFLPPGAKPQPKDATVSEERPQRAGVMQLNTEEAAFLSHETHLLAAQHHAEGEQPASPVLALDIGAFTGRSAMAMAKALRDMPEGSKVISCEIKPEYAEIAQKYWKQAKLDDYIKLEQRPALEVMNELLDKHQAGKFDIIFIDANKDGYPEYYEKAKKLLRPGGEIVLDNMLWSGTVNRPEYYKHNATSGLLRRLNEEIAKDPEVEPMLLGIGDGTLVARKLDPEHFRKNIPDKSPAKPLAF